jgi:hypothetical protein
MRAASRCRSVSWIVHRQSVSPPPAAARTLVPDVVAEWLARVRIDPGPREFILLWETIAMSTPRTVINRAPRRPGRLQQQPTKAPVKAAAPLASTGGSHNAGGQTGNGWVQQDEQS